MKFKLYLGLFVVLFLFVAYFFISHAYVFMRLTTVLGFMAIVVALLVALVALGSRK
jgi:hypothetical protein